MEIQTKLHTIFMLIGPTECGKSTFAKEYLIPKLQYELPEKNYHRNIQYLSSDEIRQEILGAPFDKYNQNMLEASNQAFTLLKEKLGHVTKYPITADFVVVDTTGLASAFREEILAVAKENHYNIEAIVFDYKNRKEYYHSERSKKIISQHIQRLKREVMPVLSREKYTAIHRIFQKDFTQLSVKVTDQETFNQCLLPENQAYSFIGDVHESLETLKKLIQKLGYDIIDNKISAAGTQELPELILNGDFIDKGNQTREIIEFLHLNRNSFRFILGNHENFVYHYLKGTIKESSQAIRDKFFDSITTLQEDSTLQEKFNQLVESAQPFYKKIGFNSRSFIATHAPCKDCYLGKIDAYSQRKQRNFRLNHEEEIEAQLLFLKEEASFNLPFHIFGHIAVKNAVHYLNKQFIDTGAVYQNKLTAFLITPAYHRTLAVESDEGKAETLPELFKKIDKVDLKTLDFRDKLRLQRMVENQINYVSGTMSPADKDLEQQELESLSKGLTYFKEKGVQELVLQPKYMGSRCQIYLHQEINQSYAVSRNGYRITQVDLTPIFETLHNRFLHQMKENKINYLILDGELLPWQVLGDALIQKKYQPISLALEKELSFLSENQFEEKISASLSQLSATSFEKDQHHLDKKALIENYGEFQYRQFSILSDVQKNWYPLAKQREAVKTYQEQVDIYAKPAPLSYQPFQLLKTVYLNGEEELPSMTTSENYEFVTDEPYLKIQLDKEDALDQAEKFFYQLTVEKQMEGIVLKPDIQLTNVVPFLKVRNKEYLSLVYGYDYLFPAKYQKLLKQKKIMAKLRTSLKEAHLGDTLLTVPLNEIQPDNEAYLQASANLLFEVAKEKTLDPRL